MNNGLMFVIGCALIAATTYLSVALKNIKIAFALQTTALAMALCMLSGACSGTLILCVVRGLR